MLLAFGVKMWLDGYSGVAVTIGTGLIVAELVGYGLTRAEATAVARYIADLEGRLLAAPLQAQMEGGPQNRPPPS